MGAIHAPGALAGVILGLCFAQADRTTGDVGLFFGAFVLVEILAMLSLGALGRHASRLAVIAPGGGDLRSVPGPPPLRGREPPRVAPDPPRGRGGGGLVYALAIAYLQDLLRERPGAGSSLIAVQRVAAERLATAVYGIGAALQGYATVGVLGAALAVAAVTAMLRLDR